MAALARPFRASPQERLAQLEARHAELVERRDLTASAPVTLAEAKTRLAAEVKMLAQKADGWRYPSGVVHHEYKPGDLADHLARAAGRLTASTAIEPTPVHILAAAAPAMLLGWMESQLAAEYAKMPAPLDARTRATKLADLAAELVKVERQMADTWWEAVDSGMQIEPPATLSAWAVLGLEPEKAA